MVVFSSSVLCCVLIFWDPIPGNCTGKASLQSHGGASCTVQLFTKKLFCDDIASFITVHPNSAVLIILESCICCAASHLSYRSCVLGDPFPQLLFTLALCAVSSVADSVQCKSLGLGGIFWWWWHTCAICSALHTVWWHTCAIRGEQQLSALYQRPDIKATILLGDITSSSDTLESS